MKICELETALHLTPYYVADKQREAEGCYIGDMLSVVMSHAEAGAVWLTVQTNVNIAAVAVLTDVCAVVIVEGGTPDEETLNAAKAQGVNIFASEESAYALACRIRELL